MNSKTLWSGLFLLFSFLGFADAAYLGAKHYLGTPVPCAELKNCEKILLSSYATIGGVPVALLGAFYYLSILVLTLVYLSIRKGRILDLVALLTGVGFLASIYFVYLQLLVMRAICPYCMFSAMISGVLFLLGVFYLRVVAFRGRPSSLKRSLPETISK